MIQDWHCDTTIHRPSIVAAFQDNDLVEISEIVGDLFATKPIIELYTIYNQMTCKHVVVQSLPFLSHPPHSILSH